MQAYLLNYSDNCFISLTNYLNEIRAHCSIDSIHKLRLTIKKLNTLLGILNYKEVHSFKKELKVIDQIFIKAGQLRDNQVQLDLLKRYLSLGVEVDFVVKSLRIDQRIIKKALRIKVKRINPFDLVLLNQRIDNVVETTNDLLVETVLHNKANELFNQISLSIGNSLEEKDLHRIRIMLKELLYVLSIFNKGKNKLKIDLPVAFKLKSLQQELGDWHDLKVLLEKVKQVIPTSKTLVESIDHDTNTLLKDIMDKLMDIERKKL